MNTTHTSLENEIEIDDIYLAAYFRLCKCTLVSRRRVGNKILFKFSNPAGSIMELREAFYIGAQGNLNDYAREIITMKQLLYVPST